jgi:hypothetical protein
VHSSDVAKARIAELECERDEWKRRAERAEGQNCEKCGCSIEVPDGSGFVAWVCAECWNAVVRERVEARADLRASHHVLCNGSGPVGEPGQCCSCRKTHKSEWAALERERDELKAEVERLKAEVAAEKARNSLNVPVADVDDFYQDEGDEKR